MPHLPPVFDEECLCFGAKRCLDADVACMNLGILIGFEFFVQKHKLFCLFAQDSSLFFQRHDRAVIPLEIDSYIDLDLFAALQLFGCHLFEGFADDFFVI